MRTSGQTKTWRVRVVKNNHTTHESHFNSRAEAQDYFLSIDIEGSEKLLQVREAPASRFCTVMKQLM